MSPRQPSYVKLVQHSVAPGHGRRAFVAPVECFVDDHALWLPISVIALVERQVVQESLAWIAIYGCVDVKLTVERPRVRVDEKLMGVEAVALLRGERPLHTPSVPLAGRQPRNIYVPYVKRTPRNDNPRLVPRVIK